MFQVISKTREPNAGDLPHVQAKRWLVIKHTSAATMHLTALVSSKQPEKSSEPHHKNGDAALAAEGKGIGLGAIIFAARLVKKVAKSRTLFQRKRLLCVGEGLWSTNVVVVTHVLGHVAFGAHAATRRGRGWRRPGLTTTVLLLQLWSRPARASGPWQGTSRRARNSLI